MSQVFRVSKYTIKKSVLGSTYRVEYPCPQCENPLRSEEDEIGTQEVCPHCAATLVVSEKARTDIQSIRERAEAEKQAQAAQRQAQAEQREAERRQKLEEKQRLEAERQAEAEEMERRHQEESRRREQARAAEEARNAPAPEAAFLTRYSWTHRFPSLDRSLNVLDAVNGLFGTVGITSVLLGGMAMVGASVLDAILVWMSGTLAIVLTCGLLNVIILSLRVICSIEEQAFAMRCELTDIKRLWFPGSFYLPPAPGGQEHSGRK